MPTEHPYTYNFYLYAGEDDYVGTFIGAAIYDAVSDHHALPEIDQRVYSWVRADFDTHKRMDKEAQMKDYIDTKVYFEILEERARQDAEWGGPKHDDEHSGIEWMQFINQQQLKALKCAEVNREFRSRLVKIAALAIAAVESFDRRYTSGPPVPPDDMDPGIVIFGSVRAPKESVATQNEVDRDLRDEFAKVALMGILSSSKDMVDNLSHAVGLAYRYADRMLSERKVKK